MSSGTVFQKIIDGRIPCHKIYEDRHVLAFLDIQPISRGHVLVIPKEPAVTLDQLSDESAAALGRVLPGICRAVMQATGTSEYNLLQNNGPGAHQSVPHVHFHVIPKSSRDAGLGIDWRPKNIDDQDARNLAAAIASQIKSPGV